MFELWQTIQDGRDVSNAFAFRTMRIIALIAEA
jgi:hypothetical protein